MTREQRRQLRWGFLCELVSQAGNLKLGRTAVMKIAYFLQCFKNVPLDYQFRLNMSGPFDNDVLYHLGQLESLGAVKSRIKKLPSGYGYEFAPGRKLAEVLDSVGNEHTAYRDAIRWALQEFGQKSASDLELLSTLVFADREAVQKKQPLTVAELCRQVKAIRPSFSDVFIREKIKELADMGIRKGHGGGGARSWPGVTLSLPISIARHFKRK